MSMSKRSSPATQPAVFTNTAERPSASGEGKRTRSEPDSCRWRRRVTPSTRCTSKATLPLARLAAKIAEVALVVSVRIRPQKTALSLRHKAGLQRHLTADFGGIELTAIAGIFHRAPVHDREIVAEFAVLYEFLQLSTDADVAYPAQIVVP